MELHDQALDWLGDPHSPLLHPDKLDSAINRSRNAAYYEGADLVRQATLLAVGISQSQAFLDGNKRAALAAADGFLRVNGLEFVGDPMEWARRLEYAAEAERGAARNAAEAELEAWLRGQVVASDSQ